MSDSYFRVSVHQNGLHSNGFVGSEAENLLRLNANDGLVTSREFERAVVSDVNDDTYEGGENEIYYKMSEDSLEMTSGQESPEGVAKRSTLRYPDTDSCLSVSPSPDPDCKTKTFDFSMIDPEDDRSNLSAALQVEQEFLDFMLSLPQIQKEVQAKEQKTVMPAAAVSKPMVSSPKEEPPTQKAEKKSPARIGHPIGNSSRVGLDHLDNLCRMMEQLGELREQNSRLQRRVQYLEDLKTLQEMHRDMQDSITARKNALSLGTISLSDSDLRLEDLNKSSMFSMDSEDSLDPTVAVLKDKDQLLEIPESSNNIQHHSSSEDDRRHCNDKDDDRRLSDKEKKGHKSAWGKVKHMISYTSKRESVRKKSSVDNDANRKSGSSIPHSPSVTSTKASIQEQATGATVDGTGASDPEEYDLDFENIDIDAASWDWDGEPEVGIWMGSSKNNDLPEVDRQMLREDHNHKRKRKPQLTITVPSSENLTHSPGRNSSRREDLKVSPVSSMAKIDRKLSPDITMTPPPSPRRSSNWTKVKQAFLTGHPNSQQQPYLHQQNQSSVYGQNHHLVLESSSSQPSSPMKKDIHSTFSFDDGTQSGFLPLYESDSASGLSPEISPDELILRQHPSTEAQQRGPASRYASLPAAVVHKNLIDLQRTLTGEFNKKLHEWEKLRSHQGSSSGWSEAALSLGFSTSLNAEGQLPQDFKKKLHEWEKMKGKEKHQVSGPDNLKMKMQNEDDLPPDFRKKLTEWEIRKALVGKGQPNVDKLQKNLGEEFSKKMAEWERMKSVGHGKISVLEMPDNSMPTNIPANICHDGGSVRLRELARLTHLAGVTGGGARAFVAHSGLDRKGSSGKFKKTKSGKVEKQAMVKNDGHKNRDKELLWLEKELNKIDREKQRLEREKEKFLEREARLEKMRHAMRQGPAEKKEIYIKTSTGEFRFEGISQTFTKKLYEWEERRGIRPESSTFVLLDPNYKAPEKDGGPPVKPKQRSPDLKQIVRCRSESSIADMGSSTILPHQSSISLNEMEIDGDSVQLQNENKYASEPTLTAEETNLEVGGSNGSLVVHLEGMAERETERPAKEPLDELNEDRTLPSGEENDQDYLEEPTKDFLTIEKLKPESRSSRNNSVTFPPYAPAEITKLIDSSGSDDNIARSAQDGDVGLSILATKELRTSPKASYSGGNERQLKRSDSQRSEESYRSLLHENMTLLGKLKEQESLCRALETQMGDIDTKMDNVADQHLKTLEKLHRHVSIMKNSESSGRITDLAGDEEDLNNADEAERNQRLIEQLKARIVELEQKGDRLMEEKESLDRAFKLHKEHETQIAESLLLRIRELQDAGAEVNIQTVQCQTEDYIAAEESQEIAGRTHSNVLPLSDVTSSSTKKRRRKKRDDYRKLDEKGNYVENEESDDAAEKDVKEYVKRKKKAPPKKVQKLHSLTADLLFQAKRLEGALIARHHLRNEDKLDDKQIVQPCRISRKRSLKGRSSLRLSKDECQERISRRKLPKDPASARTWSSIEAIASAEDDKKGEFATAASLASESQDLLAMNAELSRMAKELRKEMMNLWSFRESTSPESNCSDTREKVIKSRMAKSNSSNGELRSSGDESIDANADEQDYWLSNETRDVLEKIASLQHTASISEFPILVPSPSGGSLEKLQDQDENSFTASPEIKEENYHLWDADKPRKYEENQPLDECCQIEEESPSWWNVPRPKSSKTKPKIKKSEASGYELNMKNEENEEFKLREERNSSIPEKNETIPNWDWGDYSENAGHDDCSVDFDLPLPVESGTTLGDLLRAEQSQRESSPAYYKRCSLPSTFIQYQRNASRRSSSASEDNHKSFLDRCLFNKEDDITADESRAGTLKTNASSTVRSDVLSSSFEYDNKESFHSNVDHENEAFDSYNWVENAHLTYPPANKSEFTQFQLDKVGLVIAEVTKRLKIGDETKTQKQVEKTSANEKRNDYETEVKIELINKKMEVGGLRMRRVSDTQIPYDKAVPQSQNGLNQKQDNDALYKERYFYFRKVKRIPSIRRNQSESDVLHRDDSSSVFVRTHRTIFTVSGEGVSDKSTVTPTFLYDFEKSEAPELRSNDRLHYQDNVEIHSKIVQYLPSELATRLETIAKIEDDKYKNLSQENINVNTCECQDSCSSSTIRYSTSPGDGDSTCPSTPKTPTFFHNFPVPYNHLRSPIESKRKVLEAANESSPTVKNMIDQYNKRITEKQELLINPFKPGDPFRRSAKSISSTNKSLEILRKGKSVGCRDKYFSAEKIMKSQSTSVLQTCQSSYDQQQFLQRSPTETGDLPSNFATNTTSTDTLIDSNMLFQPSQSASSLSNLSVSTIVNEEVGILVPLQNSDRDIDLGQRASRIKKAKDEFLARGAIPKWVSKEAARTGDELSFGLEKDSSIQDGPKKPPRSLNVQKLKVPRKESFRRQSDGRDPEDPPLSPLVMKSASSGVIERLSHQHPLNGKEQRKSYLYPLGEPGKLSKGIFKLFKRSKTKDSKDLATVQHLCRQSLVVDVKGANKEKSDALCNVGASGSSSKVAITEASKGEQSGHGNEPRSSLTLPRHDNQHEDSSAASRSCPSSPVSPRKSKAVQWIEKSKRIFQSRSPSPNQKPN